MKKLLFVLSIAILAAGCSSGTTVADLPSNVTSRYVGSFQNTPGSQRGTVTIDIVDTNGSVSGNIIFEVADDESNCLRNSTVSGSSTGFNLNLTAAQAGQQFTTTISTFEQVTSDEGETSRGDLIQSFTIIGSAGPQGTIITDLGNGEILERITSAPISVTGSLNMQFTLSNQGNSISGTYTTTGDICSNGTGSGTMSLSR